MAESTIITGQFVRISQTPASIGERLIALAIDYILLGFYVFSTLALFSRIHLPSDFTMLFFFTIVYLPVLLYAFLCEMFNQGQSFGKRLMNIRVVKADGSTPGRLVPAPMASLPYRRTGDRWSGTSGRPFDPKQPANGRPCRRHHGNQGKELPQDTRQPR